MGESLQAQPGSWRELEDLKKLVFINSHALLVVLSCLKSVLQPGAVGASKTLQRGDSWS